MKAFQGIERDRLELSTDDRMVTVAVRSPQFRERLGMAVTPATARQIAAELIRLADEADA
jgi:hypothetical protein